MHFFSTSTKSTSTTSTSTTSTSTTSTSATSTSTTSGKHLNTTCTSTFLFSLKHYQKFRFLK